MNFVYLSKMKKKQSKKNLSLQLNTYVLFFICSLSDCVLLCIAFNLQFFYFFMNLCNHSLVLVSSSTIITFSDAISKAYETSKKMYVASNYTLSMTCLSFVQFFFLRFSCRLHWARNSSSIGIGSRRLFFSILRQSRYCIIGS